MVLTGEASLARMTALLGADQRPRGRGLMKINAGVAVTMIAVCLSILATSTGAVFRNYAYVDFEKAR